MSDQEAASLSADLCWDTLDYLTSLVRVWTPQDGCLYVNQAWCDLTGQGQDQFRRTGWLERIHADDRTAVIDALAAALEEARPFVADYRVTTRQGDTLQVRDWGQPWCEDGHVIGFVHTCLPCHLLRVEEPNGPTLSSWAHELRGPLNAILGWADLLATGSHPPDIVARGLKAIATNARQQATLLRRMTHASQ
jgi:PAS domain S-box-containing protein